jgi:hypothetical protein
MLLRTVRYRLPRSLTQIPRVCARACRKPSRRTPWTCPEIRSWRPNAGACDNPPTPARLSDEQVYYGSYTGSMYAVFPSSVRTKLPEWIWASPQRKWPFSLANGLLADEQQKDGPGSHPPQAKEPKTQTARIDLVGKMITKEKFLLFYCLC